MVGVGIYCATKSFILALTETLAAEQPDVEITTTMPIMVTTKMADYIRFPGITSLPLEEVIGSIRALGWDTKTVGCAKHIIFDTVLSLFPLALVSHLFGLGVKYAIKNEK